MKLLLLLPIFKLVSLSLSPSLPSPPSLHPFNTETIHSNSHSISLKLESSRSKIPRPSFNALLSFQSLPDDALFIIFTYIPDFPKLSQVNRFFLNLYEIHREQLICERLGGFNPGENYKEIGSWISRNYRNIEIIEDMRYYCLRFDWLLDQRHVNEEHLAVLSELFAFHFMNRLKTNDTILLMKAYKVLSRALINVLIKEKNVEPFKVFFHIANR